MAALTLVLIALNVVIFLAVVAYMRKQVPCPIDTQLDGKTVVLTGGNSGIGLEVAKELARRRANLIIASRSRQKGLEAVEEIKSETKWQNVRWIALDLSSFRSVRQCAGELIGSEEKIDVLINNAGGVTYDIKITEDGLENQFQINYFGPFLFTALLMPLLVNARKARIVNVSSVLYKLGQIDFDNFSQKKYKEAGLQIYSNSKLAVTLFTQELGRRYGNQGIHAVSCTPGTCNTKMAKEGPWYVREVLGRVSNWFLRSAKDGAQTIVYLAVEPRIDQGFNNGKYFVDCKVEPMLKMARDEELASKLFHRSELITGAKFM